MNNSLSVWVNVSFRISWVSSLTDVEAECISPRGVAAASAIAYGIITCRGFFFPVVRDARRFCVTEAALSTLRCGSADGALLVEPLFKVIAEPPFRPR